MLHTCAAISCAFAVKMIEQYVLLFAASVEER